MKLIATAAVLTALFLSVPAAAMADPGASAGAPVSGSSVQAAVPGAPSPDDVAAAKAAAAGARDTVGRFFATKGRQAKTQVAPMAAQVDGPTVAVNDLNPDFVSGRSPQIARFSFLATQANASDGQTASVWTTRAPSGAWVVSNIASGADEQRYGAQAGVVFREPQINAWYALRDGRVMPLNPEAVQSIGAAGVAPADYQRLTRQRYAAKLPGSAYARDGYAGGYGISPQAAGHGRTPGVSAHGRATQADTTLLPWTAGGATLVLAFGVMAFLRRRAT
ncbi:hypothetical protein Skr01_23730 [Sphaerisporangium krabiense]|uniref:Uncharacterized protein n=1 Tax=Sphaerisporangium krabiense TaxID=763782 RepID=A0A7W8Z658_9ACTN|nr:hypothetical protein [Sphaerisporangium krabiense]MBB5628121.1 hypothetical protein [Sphaerisporangium krabiense]GII62288.1 hypothetical protein Skr01_23730 [Sphaerisporangium krabiense]